MYHKLKNVSIPATRGVLQKKLCLKISQCSQGKPLLESPFNRLAGFMICNFLKKRLQHSRFLIRICKQLLLQFLLIFVFSGLFLLLIQYAFFKGPLQGLKSSPQGAQWQAPLLFEKKEKLAEMVTRCTTRCHSFSLVVIRCHLMYQSLSLDVPLVCLFINDHSPLLVFDRESNVKYIF